MNQSVLINPSLEKIHKIISVKFGVSLSQKNLLDLIEAQPEELKQALKADQLELSTLHLLVETISEKITGMHYPTEHSTPYYKEYFKKKLQENSHQYFGL